MVYVIGHKNPDTDSICSAIGYAAFKNAKDGGEFQAARAGELNPETTFVLERFQLSVPSFLENASEKDVILVDHNEVAQAADGITEANIIEILDHHKIGDVQTSQPIFFRNMPVGCTGTIVYLQYKENGLTPEAPVAGALCSAILSDTLAFRSPTCTDLDREAAAALAELAGIADIEAYAKEMFKAGSELAGKTPDEILHLDYKKFTAGSTTYGVGQVTSMDEDELRELSATMKAHMEASIESEGVDMIFFLLTNILDESSELVTAGQGADAAAAEAFQSSESDRMYLKGVVSRKKQVIPPLTEVLGK